MALLEIRKSKASRWWGAVGFAGGIVVMCFSISVETGLAASGVALVVGLVFAPAIREFISEQPVALSIADEGLHYADRVLPWAEIEDTALSYGGKRGPVLCIRLSDPRNFLGTFERLNLIPSRFHVFVPVGWLEYSPELVLRMVQEAKRAHA